MLDTVNQLWQSLLANPALLAGLAVLALLIIVAIVRVALIQRRLRLADREGREASAGLPTSETPKVTFNRKGHPGDPINMEFIATASQLGAAFAAAGWYRADEIDLVTSIRIAVDSILARKYSTAPVSHLYLYGRKEDIAFEQPGKNVRERDHIRLWNSGHEAKDGRPIWVGGATRDIAVELAKTNHLPTHRIAPDVDAERDMIVSDLAASGWVIADTHRPGFGEPTHGVNGTGDPWQTDGRVSVVTLANVWVPIAAREVRSRLGARIAKAGSRLLRWGLPKAGRDRAKQERHRRAHRGQHAPVAD